MEKRTLERLLKLINNSTANSLDPRQREIYYSERKYLADLLRYHIKNSKVNEEEDVRM